MTNKLFISILLVFITTIGFAQENKFGTYYNQRRTLFEKLPDTPREIIFLGNSITDGSEWVELFANLRVKNRGISGDTTEGVLFRLNEVSRSNPEKVFILIGINDLSKGVSKETVFKNICSIAKQIHTDSPKTKVFVQSVLPVNPSFEKFAKHVDKTEQVLWINENLKSWCTQNNCSFVDLFSRFKNENDNFMNPLYTNDGLHLTGDGYILWAEIVKPMISKK